MNIIISAQCDHDIECICSKSKSLLFVCYNNFFMAQGQCKDNDIS